MVIDENGVLCLNRSWVTPILLPRGVDCKIKKSLNSPRPFNSKGFDMFTPRWLIDAENEHHPLPFQPEHAQHLVANA